mgnify:CR=1 FL=1
MTLTPTRTVLFQADEKRAMGTEPQRARDNTGSISVVDLADATDTTETSQR